MVRKVKSLWVLKNQDDSFKIGWNCNNRKADSSPKKCKTVYALVPRW